MFTFFYIRTSCTKFSLILLQSFQQIRRVYISVEFSNIIFITAGRLYSNQICLHFYTIVDLEGVSDIGQFHRDCSVSKEPTVSARE